MTRPGVMWFRRDLRLRDHPALLAAATRGPVVPLFVLDPNLLSVAGAPRAAYLFRTLGALDEAIKGCGGQLIVRSGLPEEVLPAVVRECHADEVHVSADYGPYGRRRDLDVEAALDSIPLRRTGSPYAVGPGKVTSTSGEPFRVYSAFYRAWRRHGWPAPAPSDPRLRRLAEPAHRAGPDRAGASDGHGASTRRGTSGPRSLGSLSERWAQ